ncbi:MAG: TetR/AcrR family transcriptional regulator [Caldimonas sp.]
MNARLLPPAARNARDRILDGALTVIRSKGYSATTVDDLCAAAEVTKGAFFHHFASKEALAVAAADHWSALTSALFEAAPYHAAADARDRVLGYLDFRAAILQGTVAEYTCLVGTMVQEVHDSNPAIREACARSIVGHAATLEADIGAAIAASPRCAGIDAHQLALHTQAVLQGAFILAKATQDVAAAAASIGHLRAYFEFLFDRPQPSGRRASSTTRRKGKPAARRLRRQRPAAARRDGNRGD